MLSQELKRDLKDKKWRLQNLYKIIDKQGNSVKFVPNDEQSKLIDNYIEKQKQGKLLREYQLKARQVGITTLHCIFYLDEVLFNKNKTAVIIAHERDRLEKIFRIVKYAWETMPPMLKQKAKFENRNELYLEDLNSTIYVDLNIRGGTVNHLHIAEIAYVKDFEALVTGSFPAAKYGDITCESTANGLNHFFSAWNREDAWARHFFSWLEHKEYHSKEPMIGKHEAYLDKVGASQEQRNWWYQTLQDLQNDVDLMKQEYPANPEEAFIRSSRSVFGDLSDILILKPIREIVEPHCVIQVFEEPEENSQYSLGADPAGGYVDGDFNCFYILNTKTRKIALRWHGHEAPDRFGYVIEQWARAYRDAFVGIEVNNHGLTTLTAIKDSYPNLYQRERRDRLTNEETLELGWQTTGKSKDELIDEIKRNLRDGDVGAIPIELKRELMTFVRKENGSVEAEQGCFDDEILAFGICLMCIKANPFYELKQKVGKFMGR